MFEVNDSSYEIIREMMSLTAENTRLKDKIKRLSAMIVKEEDRNLDLDFKYNADKTEKLALRGSIDTSDLKELFDFHTDRKVMSKRDKYNAEIDKRSLPEE